MRAARISRSHAHHPRLRLTWAVSLSAFFPRIFQQKRDCSQFTVFVQLLMMTSIVTVLLKGWKRRRRSTRRTRRTGKRREISVKWWAKACNRKILSTWQPQICPEMQVNEMQALYDKHHKVSSFPKSHQNTYNSVKYETIWKWHFVMLIHKVHWISLTCISGHKWTALLHFLMITWNNNFSWELKKIKKMLEMISFGKYLKQSHTSL